MASYSKKIKHKLGKTPLAVLMLGQGEISPYRFDAQKAVVVIRRLNQ